MKSGPNSGTVDNFTGGSFLLSGWPRRNERVTYKSMGVLGAAMKSSLTVELYDEGKTWITRHTISSIKEASNANIIGNLKRQTKVILAVLPPSGGLVRTGGDYEAEAIEIEVADQSL